MKIIHNIIFIFLMILAVLLSAATPEEQYTAANVKAKSKEYEAAIDLYESVLKAGKTSADLHYNLGFAHHKLRHVGKSILNFERALALESSHIDARFNLRFAQKSIDGKLNVAPGFFLIRAWRNLRARFSAGTWGILAILTGFLALGMGALFLLGTSKKHKQLGFFAGIFLVILSLLLCFVANSKHSLEQQSHRAIVMSASISLKNIPESTAQDIATLSEGFSLTLLQQVGDWVEVKLIDGRKGWVRNEGFEEI